MQRLGCMKGVLPFALGLAIIPCGTAQIAPSKSQTLGSIKHTYLNQRVVLLGHSGSTGLTEWQKVRRVNDRYVETSELDNLPRSYFGKFGTIVAIQLVNPENHKMNALGEIVSEDETTDPYFELVVQLDDGVLAQTTAYPNTLSLNLQLAAKYQELQQDIANRLPQMIGRTVYAVGYSHLYKPDSSLEDMTGDDEILARLSILDMPLLQPIEVVNAKYIADGIVLKLKLPDGNMALSYTGGDSLREQTTDENLFTRMFGSLLTEMPKLTAEEIHAIKNGTIFKGMSKDALYDALGFPKSENDWGSGGTQLIFTDTFYVYLDDHDKVVDWQGLDEN